MGTLHIPATTNVLLTCNTNFTKFTPINKKPLNSYLRNSYYSIKKWNINTNIVHKLCSVNLENVASRKVWNISTRTAASGRGGGAATEMDDGLKKIVQAMLWGAEGVYILWLFLLPYAPHHYYSLLSENIGDPVWAISSDTVNSLVGLSLNFFFILPFLNYAGIHLMEAPVLHPMSEGLFNFVIGWTFMFAPLLFTDRKRDRFKGSLDILWGFQMFLTNTFLIPYMAIRLNDGEAEYTPNKTSRLGSVMSRGAPVVGLVGAAVCVISTLWALYGRADGNFGNIPERLEFLTSYLVSERFAYAFIWDIVLYIIFQPWFIGDNLGNIQTDKVSLVNVLRFVPVVGLVAYCFCLNLNEDF
ncbi:hypothetical protein Leryth_012526 [Lithospermum erythrorhizon]|nr:hypothetical protein Leryth_012526 [Lithospermum erythrorhizon]